MSKAFLATFGVVAVVIAGLVGWGFVNTRGNHLEPVGKVGKLRVAPVTETGSVVVVDFSITNDADQQMQVRSIEAQLEMPDGAVAAASLVPSPDLPKLFRAFPLLGEQFNEPLRLREVIPGHKTVDRMLMFQVEAPGQLVDQRKRFVVKVEDVTGPVVELSK